MNKIILSFLLILTVFPVFSNQENYKTQETPKFPKGTGAILVDEIKEGTVYGSLEKISGKNKAKTLRLIGHLGFDAPQDKILSGNKFVLIGWLAVQNIQDPSKMVMLKEPIISSFIIKNDSDVKNIVLPTFGEKDYLEDAIKRLEAGEIDAEDLKKKHKIKIPTGQQELLLPNKIVAADPKNPVLEHSKPNLTTNADQEKYASDSAERSIQRGHTSSDRYQKGSLAQSLGTGFLDPHFQTGNMGAGNLRDVDKKNQISTHPYTENLSHPLTKPSFSKTKEFNLHVLKDLDEAHLPNINGNAVVLLKNSEGYLAHLVRNGVFSKGSDGKLLSKQVEADVKGLEIASDGLVKKTPENEKRIEGIIDDLFFDFKTLEEQQSDDLDFGIETTAEMSEDGCEPEYNEHQETMTITSRVKTFENGRLVHEGVCEKTLEVYGVKRDYLCTDCADEVNREEKKAYPRYQAYWINRENKRLNLNIKVDKTSPFSLVEDAKSCGFDTTAESGFALKMSRLGFLNKFGTFKVIEDCRVINGGEKFPIEKTTKGCDFIHLFDRKISYEQKRAVFFVAGVEHEAFGCQKIEPAINHEFIIMGCKPIIDAVKGTVTNTARRRILTSAGTKLITDDCEPTEAANFQVTREGCKDKNQYVHDFITEKSYLKKRYYILQDHDLREYVTGCIRTDDAILHKTEHHGAWEHDDLNKTSTPKLSIYIDSPDEGKIVIDQAKVRGTLQQRAYLFMQEDTRPTNKYYFEGTCFRRTRTKLFHMYHRGDDSSYELLIGPGNPIISTKDECTRTDTYKNVSHKGRSHTFHGRDTYDESVYTGTTITYPKDSD